MLNIMLTGIGGQGTVLAAKVLAYAAMEKGWQVRTAETIGMAQRGGSVVSHVRMGDKGETIHEPLIPQKSADMIIAFEPAEALRVLPFLKEGGTLVTATSAVQPVTVALSRKEYHAEEILDYLQHMVPNFLAVDDALLCDKVGSKKVLNTILLASALDKTNIGISIDDIRQAIKECVKEKFITLNIAAIDTTIKATAD